VSSFLAVFAASAGVAFHLHTPRLVH
jgi:hypothetical protein